MDYKAGITLKCNTIKGEEWIRVGQAVRVIQRKSERSIEVFEISGEIIDIFRMLKGSAEGKPTFGFCVKTIDEKIRIVNMNLVNEIEIL